ncbi:MAG TPA: helix-turn-helix transcriptional regulator [Pseudonocardia sp.]|uniref:helix-turn-helix transcriptional regulator n=1 Tax=Pseudonocardia sp. TaxID=60912 RepID=UPI002B4B5BB7|nr:helix-turn-helix transcriptional regulator [Pseudonocardia sp.]HLU57680.1 helix-turn-helix transcriptional regulator [Pseudonocardia sp.]
MREGARPALTEGAAADVGRRVRELRERQGVSLSELARRARVGKATLSGLEAGTRNPTLETLQSVAAALDLPLTHLLSAHTSLRGAAVRIEVLRVFDDGPVTYELCHMRIPAGLSQRSPAHQAGVTEHATVFAGVLQAGPVDAPLRAGPGEHVEWAADVPHTYAALGADDVLASLLIRYPVSST